MPLFIGIAALILAVSSADNNLTLIAVDSEAGAAVVETSFGELVVAHVGERLGETGFRLGMVTSTGVRVVLERSYQGHTLTQELAIGAVLGPEQMVELEAADSRAAHAMESLAQPVRAPPRSSPD